MIKDKNTIIFEYIDRTCEKVQVYAGKCRYNYKCHLNSVHEAWKANDKKIAMLMCFDSNGFPFIHFVNVRNKRFIDNTLGYYISKNQCYFVRYIKKKEFDIVGNIFTNYRKEIKTILPWYYRIAHKLDSI